MDLLLNFAETSYDSYMLGDKGNTKFNKRKKNM